MDLRFPKPKHLPLKFWLPKQAEQNVLADLRFRAEPLVGVFEGELLDKYVVDQAKVFVVDQEGKGLYIASEPVMDPQEQHLYSLLMENLFFTLKPLAKMDDPLKYVEGFMWDAAEELGVVESVKKSFQKIRYFITRDAFGYGPILSPLTQILIAIVTLFAAAYMSTVFVGKFGALGIAAANLVGGAVNTAAGSAIGMASGAILGGGAGMASRVGSLAGTGLTKTELIGQAGRGFLSGAAPSAISGFLSSGGGGNIIMGSHGIREIGKTTINAMQTQKPLAEQFLNNRAGSTLTAILYKNSTSDILPTTTPQASTNFLKELQNKPSQEIFHDYVTTNYPEIAQHIKDPKTAGEEIKKHLQSLPPTVAYSNWNRAQTQKTLPKTAKNTFYQNARDEIATNKEKITALQKGIYKPNLEALDTSPRFAIDVFNTGTLTEKGTIANAKLFAGIKQLGEPKLSKINSRREQDFYTASSKVLSKKITGLTQVNLTKQEQEKYGRAIEKIRDVVVKRNPALAKNMAHYTFGKGSNKFALLMKDTQFTENALRDMYSHRTSAWLANTLSIKQTELLSVNKIFKEPASKSEEKNDPPIKKSDLHSVCPSKDIRGRPLDLLEMQKRSLLREK